MKFYISALDHARKLKFSNYVHLPSTTKCPNIVASDSVQCRKGLYFRAGVIYLSIEHNRRLCLASLFI